MEKANQISITANDQESFFTVRSSSKVTLQDAFAMECRSCGERHSVDAVYDFEGMPPETHALALQCLMQGRRRLLWRCPRCESHFQEETANVEKAAATAGLPGFWLIRFCRDLFSRLF